MSGFLSAHPGLKRRAPPMNLIKAAIERPTAVLAAVLMALLFGLVALQTIPIQLAPDVQRPVISIRTAWPGAAPVDVEREIINEQEDVLKGLEGLKRMVSSSSNGSGRITLEFSVDSATAATSTAPISRRSRSGRCSPIC